MLYRCHTRDYAAIWRIDRGISGGAYYKSEYRRAIGLPVPHLGIANFCSSTSFDFGFIFCLCSPLDAEALFGGTD